MSTPIEERSSVPLRTARATSQLSGTRTADWVGFVALVGLAGFTRFRDLGAESFWLDEATTFFRARMPLPELVASSTGKMHNPSYFMLIHQVMRMGDDEWMLRMPSAVFGVLKIAMTAVAGTITGSPRVGLVAGLLLALSPLHLQYDQEARMYALQTFGLSLALAGQLWLLGHPQVAVRCWTRSGPSGAAIVGVPRARAAWLAWVIGVACALYMHNTSVVFLLASACATLGLLILEPALRLRFFWHWAIANLVVLLLWAPWLPSLALQLGSQRFAELQWNRTPSVRQLLDTTLLLLSGGGFVPWQILVLGMGVVGAVQLRRRPVILVALAVLAFSASGLVWLISLHKPMFMPRLMLWGGPAFCVLAAHGILALRRTWHQAVATLVLTAIGLYGLQHVYYSIPTKTDWRGAARVLAKYAREDALVLAATRKETKLLGYYAERTTDRIASPRLRDARSMSSRELRAELESLNDVLYVAHEEVSAKGRTLSSLTERARLVGRAEPFRVVVDHYRVLHDNPRR